MSQILKLEFDPVNQDWFGLKFAHNERFLSFIQYGVRPDSYRRWNPNKKRWEIHRSKMLSVVSMGLRFFNHVDYSSLPEQIQILIVKYIKDHKDERVLERVLVEDDPYRALYLLPSAPWEVVQAAYKALAFLYHPDRGGDEDQFRAVDTAYHTRKMARELRVVTKV